MEEIISNADWGALVRVTLNSERYHVRQGESFKAKTGDLALGFSALTGTVTVGIGTKALVGVGTLFLSELAVGNTVMIAGELHKIDTITDDLNATIVDNHVAGATGVSMTKAGAKIIAFKTPVGNKNGHLVVRSDSSLSSTIELLEGPTVTVDSGTATQWKNRNRKLKTTLSGMLSIETVPQAGYFNSDPTVTDDGEILDTIYASADNKQSGNGDSLEWRLDADIIYAVRLTSNAAANMVNLELIAEEYED
ncbi:hypothetical protein KAR91_55810 [Candidatus Pacearchaeota archaeon]|nr:hypothetical protein [Candidatus Pacearchaeota archaeon]